MSTNFFPLKFAHIGENAYLCRREQGESETSYVPYVQVCPRFVHILPVLARNYLIFRGKYRLGVDWI